MTDWRVLATQAAAAVGTPCFVVSEQVMRGALTTLRSLETTVPLRHWLSLKTQPLARLVQAAVDWGIGVEVVSEFELDAARASGVPPQRILVNGIGKQQWLAGYRVPGLRMHFDSVAEVRALAPMAKALDWQVGVRCAIPPVDDSGAGAAATGWDQFGMTPEELRIAVACLADAGVRVSGLHCHLHTNVERVSEYRRALDWLVDAAATAGIEPEYLDLGGGLPIAGERPHAGYAAARTFDLQEFRELLRTIPSCCPGVRETWLENGRFLTGASGALVVTVLDRKDRGGRRYLICDGGRVNHARLAATETHDIVVEPHRGGAPRETIVCGPTCSPVDRLGRWLLPDGIVAGDRIVWQNAGAYHIPLETRFSVGRAPVVWFDADGMPEVVRERETSAQWWDQWTVTRRMTDALSR